MLARSEEGNRLLGIHNPVCGSVNSRLRTIYAAQDQQVVARLRQNILCVTSLKIDRVRKDYVAVEITCQGRRESSFLLTSLSQKKNENPDFFPPNWHMRDSKD
jgi:hypothetical protein